MLSVVIPTFNRSQLLSRAVDSVRADLPEAEIVIVDDASTDGTQARFGVDNHVVYRRLDRNSGVGTARNVGLEVAAGTWVLFLDDDDVLLRGAGELVREGAARFDAAGCPLVQFGRSNAALPCEFALVSLDDYLVSRLSGDFCPLVHRERFLGGGFRFPAMRVGAEHLLWYDIAERFGIPTWRGPVAARTDDAPERLCSVASQLRHPEAYAEMLELTLQRFGRQLFERNARHHLRKQLGCATYWLLAGRRARSLRFAFDAIRKHRSAAAAALLLASALPNTAMRSLFARWRRAYV